MTISKLWEVLHWLQEAEAPLEIKMIVEKAAKHEDLVNVAAPSPKFDGWRDKNGWSQPGKSKDKQ